MIQTFSIGDHARMFTPGLKEAFGTAKGLGHLLSQCGIVTAVSADQITLDMGEYGLVKCSAKNAYQTMPAQGFEDIPDFMTEQTNHIPTLREELNRKLGDTLDWLIRRHKAGAISDEACAIASDALFMSVSGLARDDLMTVVTAIGSYLPSSKPAAQVRVFKKSDSAKTLAVCWTPDQCELVIHVDGAEKRKSFETPALAKQAFAQVGELLGKGGYVECC